MRRREEIFKLDLSHKAVAVAVICMTEQTEQGNVDQPFQPLQKKLSCLSRQFDEQFVN